MYGGLIVHKPVTMDTSEMAQYGYDEELLFLVGDWYHPPATNILAKFMNVRSNGNEVYFYKTSCDGIIS